MREVKMMQCEAPLPVKLVGAGPLIINVPLLPYYCSQSLIKESEGGVITNSSHQADYLFSTDASHRDTHRIYNSLQYIENKVTMFHASFLRSHTQLKNKTMATLGHFILPPPSLHEEIRREIGNFIWEADNASHIQQHRDQEDEPMNPEYDERQVEDERTRSCKRTLQPSLEDNRDLEYQKDTTDREQSEDVRLYALHKYPKNNMFSGYTSIDQLKKFSEELHDFTPDTSEYCVLYVHEESSDFPGIKTAHNKK